MTEPTTTFVIVDEEDEIVDPNNVTPEFGISYLKIKKETEALKIAEKYLKDEGHDSVMVYKLVPAFQLVQAKPTIHRLDDDDV